MRLLAVAAAALLPAGCYLGAQALGQARILLNRVSIDVLIADPSTPAPVRSKLRLVRELKEFGEREMGLAPSDNFEDFHDTAGRPITYLVTACARHEFRPYTWWFPVVGEVPYKGFFSYDDAVAEARRLEALDLDVSFGTAAAYSTLGYFPDPVLSTMLDHPEEELSALILHELTHGTLYLPGGADFNEGLASFVGWQGALEFARRRRGAASDAYARTVGAYARAERRDARALELYRKLADLYASGRSREEILESKAGIFAGWREARSQEAARAELHVRTLERERAAAEREGRVGPLLSEIREARVLARQARSEAQHAPRNNAEVQQVRRYGRFDEFRARFEACGGDWRRYFAGFRTTPGSSTGSGPSRP
jgi:predicted aminopeptidase